MHVDPQGLIIEGQNPITPITEGFNMSMLMSRLS